MSWINPDHTTTLDHRKLLRSPEWQQLAVALNDAALALTRHTETLSGEEFDAAVAELIVAIGYADTCDLCKRRTDLSLVERYAPCFPFAIHADHAKEYRCPRCGNAWMMAGRSGGSIQPNPAVTG
jgi:hypothetical protein